MDQYWNRSMMKEMGRRNGVTRGAQSTAIFQLTVLLYLYESTTHHIINKSSKTRKRIKRTVSRGISSSVFFIKQQILVPIFMPKNVFECF
jgi:hypothetical protein